ncbi:Tdc2 [Cordylochernes scorpioides]|uniref:Tdc2 n=1 Tax=Cordylochernes scorpioides TaxID=51811 RepID=A0ABY6L6Y5_9ARAC|nr:Tdc2 [Cordylochernes scorpioides]
MWSRGPRMDSAEFQRRGREMVDYIANYLESLSRRPVTPNVEPGYLRKLLPYNPPQRPENWDTIMEAMIIMQFDFCTYKCARAPFDYLHLLDVDRFIMPGVTHWQHPQFHAYFPAGNSYPSILADMLSDAIGCVGFSWAASPACTELETIVLDWLGKMIGLPEEFLCLSDKSLGGGVIQGSASECVLVSLLAARHHAILTLKQQFPNVEEGVLLSKLMAYCSKEAHSSVEKAAMIAFVNLRILDTDDKFQLRGATLAKAMADDRAKGLVPFFVTATIGTTSCCSYERLTEVGPVCRAEGVWLHVDAAYAGAAAICPEFKYLIEGVEVSTFYNDSGGVMQYATSFMTNPNKWMLVNFDCSTMWVKNRFRLTEALVVDPLYLQHSYSATQVGLYLQHSYSGGSLPPVQLLRWVSTSSTATQVGLYLQYSYSDKAIDYRHWGVPLSRRFRSLKLWFVIRKYGVEGIQKYIREHVRLAKKFEALVRKDDRFEVVNEVLFGLVCFRLKDTDAINQRLLTMINASGKLHMVPASLNECFVIRFCVCSQNATDADILYAWEVITQFTDDLVEAKKELRGKIKVWSNQRIFYGS